MIKNLSRLIAFCTLLAATFIIPKQSRAQVGWPKTYNHGIVVSGSGPAAKVGAQILQQGGNAVDAAVAVQFAMAVTQPRAGNIGGGGFMVIHLSNGTDQGLDFREKAPHEAGRKMYIRNGKYISALSRDSAIASGVPGVVDGMVRAEKKYGDLSLSTVIAPAIKLARDGYNLSWFQARLLNENAEAFKAYSASTKYFTRTDEQPFKEGDLFIQKDLAETLQRVADHGRAGFYEGKTAKLIAAEMKKQQGIIDQKDLTNYRSKWRDLVQTQFRGYTLHIMPSPSSGGIAISQMLDMLRPFNLEAMGFASVDYIHTVTEAMRRAFADRAYFMGDQDFVDIPRDTLLSWSYNRKRMQNFNPRQATRSSALSHGSIPNFHESHQTTHYSIVDSAGNAVAVTTTLNGFYGNHISIGGAGFLMNNEMDDFASKPGEPNMFGLIQGEANAIKPGKRMLSSMSPTIVTKNDSVRMVLGAAGGPTIINTTLETFLDRAIFDMNAQQAIAAPRFHHQWLPDTLYYEHFTLGANTRQKLESMGHHLGRSPYHLGVGHIIYVDADGKRESGVDPRGDGAAAGY